MSVASGTGVSMRGGGPGVGGGAGVTVVSRRVDAGGGMRVGRGRQPDIAVVVETWLVCGSGVG